MRLFSFSIRTCTMMNNFIVRFLFYCYLLLLTVYAESPTQFYPSLSQLVDYLVFNSSLPPCTITTCQQTFNQTDYSQREISDEMLLKLSVYDRASRKNLSSHGPYLISSTGIYRGQRMKYAGRYIDQFLGIYYAEIPRSLRKPVKKNFNYTLQNATKFSPCCMQSIVMAENLSYGSFAMQHQFSEDCLSLNIYRADLRYGERRKAIMVFSHGGSNQLGGGSLFDGSVLASEGDIIVITMNFRLNYHGFLSSGDQRLRGNYGLWDQLLAVEWIYENAHLFGGDRHRIVLVGHSAGAGNVMLIPASPYCRGMVRRVISQSGTGLAPWSINRQPMKLLERFSQDFNCTRSNDNETLNCINKLLEGSNGEIYRLHLSLNIADDNPYPVIDNDFINDTIENILESDAYANVDFLTGVTLNEGLYFAEYHIKHLFSDLQNQSDSNNESHSREKRSLIPLNTSAIIAPDITFVSEDDDDNNLKDNLDGNKSQKIKSEQISPYDPGIVLQQFIDVNYVERYIDANFQQGKCFIQDIKNRYELPARDNIIGRLQLYIDLVSDLMFNFHMVRCLNLRARRNSSNYAYIYSHRPTYKVRSTFRDQLKILPQAIGHFAELDYVFGVPLVRNYRRIHRNVNMSYYNYSSNEEDFSRQMIRYWSNFIKTGNPNEGSFSSDGNYTEWKAYTENEHNYIFFQLNDIRTEVNYFDSMYNFWLDIFRIEEAGGCSRGKRKNQLITLLIFLVLIACIPMFYLLWKYLQKRKQREFLSSPTASHPYPDRISA